MIGFRAAIRFLTILPVRGGDAPPGRAAALFPLIGAILGAAGAGVFLLTARALPISIAALATVAFWTAISRVPREDGVAGVAVLTRSRIGTVGAIAIVLSVLARWQALEYLATPRVLATLMASQAVPRAAMVAMAWVSRPAGSGLGYALASTLSTPAAMVAMALGAAAALLCGWRAGFAIIAGLVLIVQATQGWSYRRLGGVNGDCLGFTEQLIEIFILAMFACRSCAW